MKTAGAPALWYTHWDPTEPVATRPLSIRKDGTWYTYGHDLTKNVTELYKTDGTIASTYDYIGNRENSQENAEKVTVYTTNQLNQYSEITEGAETHFTPEYDADGNQTKIKTSTGQWSVGYNALNQATIFTQGNRRIECRYDYMSRRVEKTVYDGENILSRKCFLYNGYLQVAELDASNATETVLPVLRKTYLWDPMETIATRVLVMTTFNQEGGYEEDLYYTHDLLKNTIALFGIKGGRRGLYEYSPYGNILKQEGDWAEENPFRFSSEYSDDELGLVYYNYRYYNPMDGRWISREPVGEMENANLFSLHGNNTISKYDYLGLYSPCSGKASTTPNSENNPNKDENNDGDDKNVEGAGVNEAKDIKKGTPDPDEKKNCCSNTKREQPGTVSVEPNSRARNKRRNTKTGQFASKKALKEQASLPPGSPGKLDHTKPNILAKPIIPEGNGFFKRLGKGLGKAFSWITNTQDTCTVGVGTVASAIKNRNKTYDYINNYNNMNGAEEKKMRNEIDENNKKIDCMRKGYNSLND